MRPDEAGIGAVPLFAANAAAVGKRVTSTTSPRMLAALRLLIPTMFVSVVFVSAPIGYLNRTQVRDGIERRGIVVDDERAPHIVWAFESYETGLWSISEITDELERRGLKSRPTARFVGTPLTRSQVHRMLSNPYYAGRLCYGGIEYDGKHPAVVSEETFHTVQTILANRRLAGDRSWKRQQYLKGTVFCHRCGERLGYAHSKGRGGEYAYFFCLGRHRRRTDCDLPYLPADAVEAAVIERWGDVRFTDWLRSELEAIVDTEFTTMRSNDVRMLATQRNESPRWNARNRNSSTPTSLKPSRSVTSRPSSKTSNVNSSKPTSSSTRQVLSTTRSDDESTWPSNS